MVLINVCVTEAVDELTTTEATDLGQHTGQEGVASNVEWDAETHIT